MKIFNPKEINLTKYLFFTGKGGVGKTSIARLQLRLPIAEKGFAYQHRPGF